MQIKIKNKSFGVFLLDFCYQIENNSLMAMRVLGNSLSAGGIQIGISFLKITWPCFQIFKMHITFDMAILLTATHF